MDGTSCSMRAAWGDLHLGDPALDSLVLVSLTPVAPRILDIQGEVNPHTVARARSRVSAYGSILLDYSHEIVDPALEHGDRTALFFARDP